MTANQLEIYTLCSGSKGNCAYIRAGETRILIDLGLSMKACEEALCSLGTSLEEIDGIFVTHAHSDHVKGLPTVARRYSMPIHMSAHTAIDFFAANGHMEERVNVHPTERFTVELDGLTIHSFVTPHDTRGSVGYIIETQDYRFGMCTDTGCISKEMVDELSACQGCIVESNYDREMLKNGPYPYFLKQRINSNTGHLSNDKCGELVCMLARLGVKKFMLGHLSEENNTPELALRCACTALAKEGMCDVDVTVAGRYCITRF